MGILEILLILTTTMDLVSTEMVLREGGVEMNPLMQDRGVRIGAAVAQTVGLIALSRWLSNRGNEGAAKAVLVIPTIGRGVVSGWNVGVYVRIGF